MDLPNLLEIKDLRIQFANRDATVQAVRGISFSIKKGETFGLVGESGSGKSVTALSIMRLLAAPPAKISGDGILFFDKTQNAQNLLELPENEIRKLRGSEIAMIFQEPMTSLNPVFRCGEQVAEAIRLHKNVSPAEAKSLTIKQFRRVRLDDAERVFNAFPHQISGGQKQRVMIAMAVCCQPALLIADEPTTALDVRTQKSILDLLAELRAELGMAMLFISHDLAVVSEICGQVAVMHEGKIVETGSTADILKNPKHPYTQGLLQCRPRLDMKRLRLPTMQHFLKNLDGEQPSANFPEMESPLEFREISTLDLTSRREKIYSQSPILKAENLLVRFPKKKNLFGKTREWLNAVNGVGFEIFPGESLGIVGESGSGKTTIGRAIAKLQGLDSGKISFQGVEYQSLREDEFRSFRREIQIVFQDPYASLNPLKTAGEAIAEPMKVHGLHGTDARRREKTLEILGLVGLSEEHAQRLPSEFSGGQRQRIAIARALALEPKLLVCDEIVSALDVSVQATILNLLADLQRDLGLTYLFISHDLGVVNQFCDRVLVLNSGQIAEQGFPENVLKNPKSEYAKQLISAIPMGGKGF